MELEAPGSEFHGLVLGSGNGVLAGARVHAAERDQHVVVPCGARDELRDAVGLMLELRAGIHGEDDGGHVQFAVHLGDPVQRRGAVLGLEIFCRGFGQRLREGAMPATVHLKMDVHVDRIELRGVDAQFITSHNQRAWAGSGCSSAGSGRNSSP